MQAAQPRTADWSPPAAGRGVALRLTGLAAALSLLALLWWQESPWPLLVALAALILYGGVGTVGQLRRLRATQRAYQLAMQAAHDGFWEWNPVSKRLAVGPRLLEILGYSQNFLPDTHAWLELVHPDDRAHYNRTVAEHLKGRTPFFYCEYRVRSHSGEYRWIASRGIAVRDARGVAYQMAGSVTDVTERKRHEEQIAHLARHDQLTGLSNRFLLAERLDEALAAARSAGGCVALIFIDLDRFKDINDSLGHRLGDHLLQAVAGRLAGGVRAGETLVRQGGDEFIALLPDVTGREAAEARAQALLELLETPFLVDGNHLHVGASVGLSLFPDDGDDAEQLLRNADTAMYAAKRDGGGTVRRHTPAMKERVLHRASMEARLRRAIEQEAFALHYQPQFETATGRLLGAEALLRWRDGEEWIPPDRFIPVAEETGLIVPIGDWVLENAVACLGRWRGALPRPLRMAINLSPRQFWSGDLTSRVLAAAERHGVDPGQLELEITESMLLRAEGEHVAVLRALRGRGVRLALDDFGTGYSSLSYLHRLPFTSLKIDRSFVGALFDEDGNYSEGGALIPAIVAMAHSLELEVVAEGVETSAQLVLLRDLGVDLHQGFFSGRPAAEADFVRRFLAAGGR
ncbi:MAG: EAL domain-containing protein [Rhodocyclaceae bacterium]|nr:EAL domain-containing protein [Rhodocyclaceae bacterium]